MIANSREGIESGKYSKNNYAFSKKSVHEKLQNLNEFMIDHVTVHMMIICKFWKVRSMNE